MEEALIVGRYLYWEQWVLVGVVLTVTLLLWKTLWVSRGSRKNQHIPLPLGSTGWPLIGESISFYRGLRSAQPRQFIQDHEKKYGPVFRTNLFGRKRMVVSVDPEFNRYVLQNEGRLFQANYPQSFRNLVGKYGLMTVHGDLQKKLHAVAANLLKQDNLISDFMDDIQNFLLADMQRWQHKGVIHLQEECNKVEHDSLLKDNGNRKLTWDDYQTMKFTHCVIKETLRLGNAGLGAYREAKQDIKFKDFVIPKEWTVLVLLFGTHLDEKYYPEPFTFNPWRWQNESPLALSDNPWFMPFGRGARLCPGFHLARFEIALFLHNFVTKFRWEPIGDDQICYFPAPTLVNHLPIRLYDR